MASSEESRRVVHETAKNRFRTSYSQSLVIESDAMGQMWDEQPPKTVHFSEHLISEQSGDLRAYCQGTGISGGVSISNIEYNAEAQRPAEVNTHGNFDLGSSARRQVSALETTTKLRHYRISRIIGHSSSSEASVVVLVAAQAGRKQEKNFRQRNSERHGIRLPMESTDDCEALARHPAGRRRANK